jgi:hypothetical protein
MSAKQVRFAVALYIRWNLTDYNKLLARGFSRNDAQKRVDSKVMNTLVDWESPLVPRSARSQATEPEQTKEEPVREESHESTDAQQNGFHSTSESDIPDQMEWTIS